MFRMLFVQLAIQVLFATTLAADDFVLREGENWRGNAEMYLWNRAEGRLFDSETDRATHCMRLNNYGCLKHSPQRPYDGTPNADGSNGAHDGRDGNRGHAVFQSPEYSVAASFYWFENSFKNLGLTTANQLAERYAPWCDTSGSAAVRTDSQTGNVWGRTCTDGHQPPAGFDGMLCEEPPGGVPTAEQCRMCNCPTNYTRSWLRGTGLSSDEELDLFDAAGFPTDIMKRVLIGHTPWEIGYRPSEELVEMGASLFSPRY